MFARLLNLLSAPRPAPLPEPDEKLALGVLLVRVAMSDHAYQVSEISRIDRLLARLFDLGPVEAARMRATCEKLERQAPGSGRFAALIRDRVSEEARIRALEALWEVALADGHDDASELAVIETAREALGLSDAQDAAARAMAETGGAK